MNRLLRGKGRAYVSTTSAVHFNSNHILGTCVPVEEPSTASEADAELRSSGRRSGVFVNTTARPRVLKVSDWDERLDACNVSYAWTQARWGAWSSV